MPLDLGHCIGICRWKRLTLMHRAMQYTAVIGFNTHTRVLHMYIRMYMQHMLLPNRYTVELFHAVVELHTYIGVTARCEIFELLQGFHSQ